MKLKVVTIDGVQKEAFFYCVPCITMCDETMWVETAELRWNIWSMPSERASSRPTLALGTATSLSQASICG